MGHTSPNFQGLVSERGEVIKFVDDHFLQDLHEISKKKIGRVTFFALHLRLAR